MKTIRHPFALLAFFSFSLLFLGCGSNDDDFDPCMQFKEKDLVVTIQDEYTTLPGKVSIFFKVDDRDGLPAPGLTEANFTVYEEGRNDDCPRQISNTESNARISPNAQVFCYNTMLVLDLSGSVITNSLEELKTGARSFIDNVMPDEKAEDAYKLGIWWFDGEDELHPLIDFTSDTQTLKSAIDGLDSSISDDPSTNLYGAVIKSTDIAAQKLSQVLSQNIIGAGSLVIFTDGTDQAARYTDRMAFDAVEALDTRIRVFTIGLGDEIDTDVLETIGRDGSIFAENTSELETRFVETGAIIQGEANSYYLFEYCSPKRDGSGESDLTLEVTSDGRKGSITTTFDATGFTAGCE